LPHLESSCAGKRDAAAIAQAKAAHNQAIMQELNAFTQLDPNARHWEVSRQATLSLGRY
jgi:hypothetical protein